MITIVESIKKVLANFPDGLTSLEVYEKIIEANLYTFKAISPQAIVNGMIRRHCFGLNYPSSSPVKYFKIAGEREGKTLYSLYNESENKGEIDKKSANLHIDEELLPEEKMQKLYEEYICGIKSQLMNAILNSSPAFFEQLVVDLLLKMGYGYDGRSGKVTRYTRDGGVDGIIEEDNLGLNKIYIQAKRYNFNNKVSTAEVDQFVGVMSKKFVKKGVFITTSDFVKIAKSEYSKDIGDKTVKLINGDELMNLLIKYEIGVKSTHIYKNFIIDENYFSG